MFIGVPPGFITERAIKVKEFGAQNKSGAAEELSTDLIF
jgi:hypothetical protein